MEYSSDETGSNGEEESQIRHFLRNDSEEAELTELIQAFPGESPTKSQRQQEGFQKEQEERFCKNQDEEGRLRREHQEDKLREEQHKDGEKFPREQQHQEKERLCRKHLDEKLRRDQQDEERLRKERQQEVRLWQSQEDKLHMDQEKFQWECQVEEERPKHDQQRCYLAQREESYLKEPEKHFHNNEESEISNVVRHISDDIEEVRDFSQTLPVMPPKWGCPVMPPPSPSRPKSPWGKLDPYDSCEEDRDYVGFATLPNQVHRKYVKKGFEFTLMVAGESGLGKSTLINSLFLTDLYQDRQLPCPEECVTQTVEIVKQTVDIQEKGVRLRLTVVDTPGYGDAVNNENCWKPIADYIDQQFEQYFRDESGLNRKNLQDTRVHCCLYFLSPLGHGMRPLDIEFLRALQDRVNIVPILGKADSLTTAELLQKKQRIRDELDYCGIRIYQFPDCDSDQDEEFKMQDMELKKSIPFAVIGSNAVVEVNGRRVRGRIYPWGVVEVENEQHCDFVKLRTMLIRTHMQDLKDVTRETHYENYRAQCIQSLTQRVVRERNRNKLTRESGTDFPIPSVPPSPDHETQRLIREKDEELRRMQEVLQKMQRQMKDSR